MDLLENFLSWFQRIEELAFGKRFVEAICKTLPKMHQLAIITVACY